MNCENVAFSKAARGQTSGGSICGRNQLIVSERAPGSAINQRGLGGKSRRVFEDERGDGSVGNFNVWVRALEDHVFVSGRLRFWDERT